MLVPHDPVLSNAEIEEFSQLVYAMRHRVSSPRPGNHASRSPGSFGRFNGLRRITDDTDTRRLDLRASLVDPSGTVWVRQYRQEATGPIMVLVDLSGSMGFVGSVSRHAVAAGLAAGLAKAALRSGDSVGLFAAQGNSTTPLHLEPTRRRSAPQEFLELLSGTRPGGAGLAGLAAAARTLPPKPSLVFLISDFQAPIEETRVLLAALGAHDVRPIVLKDPVADHPSSRFGLVHLDDLETGERKIAVMRPSLVKLWRRRIRIHEEALKRLFAQSGCQPITVAGQIDLEWLFESLIFGDRHS